MFSIAYLLIGVILLLLGLVSVGYFGYLLKSNGRNNVTIVCLTESLVTVLIGVFYVYCAVVMAQKLPIEEPITTTENDIIMMEEITTSYPTVSTTASSKTAEPPLATNSTEEFLKNYQNMFKNKMKHKNPRQMNITNPGGGNCFTDTFMHSSMFLYSFLHCVLSLIMTPSVNGEENLIEEPSHLRKQRLNFLSKLATSFLTPILSVIMLYLILRQSDKPPANMLDRIFNNTGVDSTILEIISKPLNVTSEDNSEDIDNVIQNVYKILNSTTKEQKAEMIPTRFNIADYMNRRKPKQVEECSDSTKIVSRIYALIIFLCYFLSILFAKVKEAKLEACDRESARHLNWSVASFAGLWLLGVMEMFTKVFLFESADSILTDVFLSFGNLNRVSIAALNYNNAKKMVRKVRQVKPKESLEHGYYI